MSARIVSSVVASTVVSVVCASTAVTSAAPLFFDFGEASQPTGSNYNNVSQAQLPILNALDSTGAGTGISLLTSGFNPGSNQNGTQAPTGAAGIFEPQATRDNLFGHTALFNQPAPLPLATLSLGGLDGSGNTQYEFVFFGSRTGVTDNRETKFEVIGANTGAGLLDTANNLANVAVVAGIIPTSAGELTVRVSPGPNNNNSSGFYYLGAMRLEASPVPEPTTFAGLALLVGTLLSRRRIG